MSPSETMERLRTLRQTAESKGRDADSILAKSNPTQEDLRKAERLFDQRDEAVQQIKRIREDLGQPVKGAPYGGAKHSGPNPFRHTGSEPAGRTEFGFNGHTKQLEMLAETGPGAFGEKTWEAMQTKEYALGFNRYFRTGNLSASTREFKALELGLDGQGGVLAPPDLFQRIIERDPAPTRMRGKVTTVNTGRDRIEMPRVAYTDANDRYTTGFRVTKTGEKPSSSTVHRVDDDGLFGHFGIDIYTRMISGDLTNDMVEDSQFPLMSWFTDKMSETVDLLYEDEITNGTGIGECHGILSKLGGVDRPPLVALGGASALTADGILDLEYALPEQYDQNAVFVFNKTSTGKAMAKLRDSVTNERLFFRYDLGIPSLEAGTFRNVRGYPYLYNHFMPNVAENSHPIIFGDLRGYYLAQRIGFAVQVLRERYAEENKVVILGRLRFGGKPIEFWKMRIGKVATSV